MKGFRSTGKGPQSGFHFKESSGFTGSAGRTTVKSYLRSTPKVQSMKTAGTKAIAQPNKFAKGGLIAAAHKNPGALHRALGVPEGTKIPAKKMAKAAKSSSPLMQQRVNLAKNLGAIGKCDGGPMHKYARGGKVEDGAGRADSVGDSGMAENTPDPSAKKGPAWWADFKKGGYAKSKHADAKQDVKLLKSAVKPAALKGGKGSFNKTPMFGE